jgi:hypothetical protein
MSKSIQCIVAVALLGAAAAASAQDCPNGVSRLNRVQIGNQIVGKTMCATSGNDRWQEFHQGTAGDLTGPLIDYKKGPNDPVDKTQQVGTWSISGNGGNTLLVHNYGASATYSWAVCGSNGGPYTLVSSSGATVTNVTVRNGQTGC